MSSLKHHQDKENQILSGRTKDLPKTPNKIQKKKFATPPLNPGTRIPLGGKQDNRNQIRASQNDDKQKPSSRLPRRTPVKRLLPNSDVNVARKPNSLLAKLNELNDFESNDSKLNEFLKHEKGDDIDIEIVPEKQEPLPDAPDDSISFKDINLAKIYKTPFHVPEFQESDEELDKALHVEFNHDDDFLQWDFNNNDIGTDKKSTAKTPVTMLKNMEKMGIDSKSPVGSNTKKRFMMSTTASANKKSSVVGTTPLTGTRLSNRLVKEAKSAKKEGRNLLRDLVDSSDENQEDGKLFDEEYLKVDDDELRSLF